MYVDFSPRKVGSRGPDNARILVVGEAPGEQEDRSLKPFVGQSGMELDRMLAEARFVASAIRYTNVIRYKPRDNDVKLAFATSEKKANEGNARWINGRRAFPVAQEGIEDLRREIEFVKPSLIIALGATALWALCAKEGIDNWRSSTLDCVLAPGIPVIPTYHPASILRAWDRRYLAVHDLARANRIFNTGVVPRPAWNFRVRPSFQTVMDCFDEIERRGIAAVDVETKRGRIVCAGFAWDKMNAVCVPFVTKTGASYWSDVEETTIIFRIHQILSNPAIKIIGQNFHYDAQYFARNMLVIPNCHWDTMLAQHILFPGTDKSLAHLSSVYCPYHIFWKDDGKEWNPVLHEEEQLWIYNCTDCVKTFEVMESQQVLIQKYKMQAQQDYMMRLWPHVLITMLRGIRVDLYRKEESKQMLEKAMEERQRWLDHVIGRPFNPKSPLQMKQFFLDEMGIKGRKSKLSKGVSFDKKNLAKIAEDHILLWPIVQTIEEHRSLGVFKSTFAEASLDLDDRMRCSYNMGGTETLRFSSSESAFGIGTNLQNIPAGNRSKTMKMPNMRSNFLPDEGMEIAEVDLAGADAQVVAWEADDNILKDAFRRGVKIHTVNAKDLFGGNAGPDGKREPYYTMAKAGVHATNYLCSPPTLAKTLGITIHEAEKFQKRWFEIHPGIKRWHERVMSSLQMTRSVQNKFGFRRVYFDRIDSVASEAVAWIPQSTVAIVINWAFIKVGEAKDLPVDILLQVHDSLVFQYPKHRRDEVLKKIHPLLLTPVPYPDPLTIPLGLKISDKSWGECEDYKWPE